MKNLNEPDGVSNKLASESKCQPCHGQSNESVGQIQSLNPGVVLESFEHVSDLGKMQFNQNQDAYVIPILTIPF